MDESVRERVAALARAAEGLLGGGHYAGASWRTLERYREFHEDEGTASHLEFVEADQDLMRAYAALSVWGRVVLHQQPESLAAGLLNQVAAVERSRYPKEAFPYAGDAGKTAILDAVVPVDTDPSLSPEFLMAQLGNALVLHEWTAKPGKRIYDYLMVRLPTVARTRICSRQGLLAKYEENHDFFEVAKEVALMLVPIVSHEIIVLPLAATTAVIAVHRGMHLLCEDYEDPPPAPDAERPSRDA